MNPRTITLHRATVAGERHLLAARHLPTYRAAPESAWRCPRLEALLVITMQRPRAMGQFSTPKGKVHWGRLNQLESWVLLQQPPRTVEMSISTVVHRTPRQPTLRPTILKRPKRVTCLPLTPQEVSTTIIRTIMICNRNMEHMVTARMVELRLSFAMFRRGAIPALRTLPCSLDKGMLVLRRISEMLLLSLSSPH